MLKAIVDRARQTVAPQQPQVPGAPQPVPMAKTPQPVAKRPVKPAPGVPAVPGVPGIQPVGPLPGGPLAPPTAPGVPAPAAPAAQPGVPAGAATGGVVAPIVPGDDLRSKTVLPGQGVDRLALMRDALADYDTATAPALEARQRQIGANAARYGRIGSGVVTTELGTLGSDYERNRMLFGNELLRGAVEDRVGDDRMARDETRGERSYQDSLAEQAYQRRLRERTLGNEEMQQQFGRDFARGQLGVRGADFYQQNANQSADAIGELLRLLAARRAAGQGGAPGGTPAGGGK